MLKMMRWGVLLFLVMMLAACSEFSSTLVIDLVPQLGDKASGTYNTKLTKVSKPVKLELLYPSKEGRLIDLSDQAIPISLSNAELLYDVELTHEGVTMEGTLKTTLFLAAEGGQSLWQAENQLTTETMDLGKKTNRLEGSIVLSDEQLALVNEKKLWLGLQLIAEASVEEAGEAKFSYDIQGLDLTLDAAFAGLPGLPTTQR